LAYEYPQRRTRLNMGTHFVNTPITHISNHPPISPQRHIRLKILDKSIIIPIPPQTPATNSRRSRSPSPLRNHKRQKLIYPNISPPRPIILTNPSNQPSPHSTTPIPAHIQALNPPPDLDLGASR
jgi:hypothetical protein